MYASWLHLASPCSNSNWHDVWLPLGCPLQTVPKGLHQRTTGAEAPSPRPTINSVKATIVALGKASSVFQGSRAYMFATDMAFAEKEGDVDFFASRLYAYNNVCRLDTWYLR